MEAYWTFLFNGDAALLRRDLLGFELPSGLSDMTFTEAGSIIGVSAHETALEQAMTMPYPNQLFFLDYVTGTENYKNGNYKFAPSIIVPNRDGTKHWTVNDYLADKTEI